LNIDIQYEVISLFSYSIKACSDFTLHVLLVSGIKRYSPNKITTDWFETHSKKGDRFCSIAELNRIPPIIRLSLTGFSSDLVQLDTSAIMQIIGI